MARLKSFIKSTPSRNISVGFKKLPLRKEGQTNRGSFFGSRYFLFTILENETELFQGVPGSYLVE
jgi:hypothetical protein